MKTIVALYDNISDANATVRDLIDYGIPRTDISLMASDDAGNYKSHLAGVSSETGATAAVPVDTTVDDTASGAATGAGIGAVVGGLGGLMVGLGVLVIPGIGPVLAAGPLAAAIATLTGAGVGALAGGAAGGLLGVLVSQGVPEETAGYYAEGVRRGGVLVSARAEDHQAEDVRRIMDRHTVVDIHERVRGWREQGWTHFDPNAPDSSRGEERSNQASVTPSSPVSDVPTSSTFGGRQYDTRFYSYEPDFRQYYVTTLGSRGRDYEYYEPAYYYGYQLATDDRYRDWMWEDLEPEARRDWEHRYPGQGAWEDFKDAVQYSWMRVKEGIREAFD